MVYDRSSDKATATAREWYARKAAAVPKKRGPPPMMSAASSAAAADGRVVLEPDYRLAGALAGGAGLVTLGVPLGLGLPLGAPLGALAAFLASRANTVRLVFDADALEVMTTAGAGGTAAAGGAGGLRASGENFAVGGSNRWAYTDIVEWALYPTAEAPALVYFRERQTRPEGQGHLFPVLFAPDVLLHELEQRVGSERRVMGAPRL